MGRTLIGEGLNKDYTRAGRRYGQDRTKIGQGHDKDWKGTGSSHRAKI